MTEQNKAVVALAVAVAGAKADEQVIDAAKVALQTLDAGAADVERVRAMTPEQKREEIARRKAVVQTLHDVACAWLDVEERTDAIMAQVNGMPERSSGFDFGGVFGR